MKLSFTFTSRVIFAFLVTISINNSGFSQNKGQTAAFVTGFDAQFESVVNNGSVTIKWAPNNAITSKDFVIERSFDQNSFKAVCYFLSADKAEFAEALCHFSDRSAELAGKTTVYYRIRQTGENAAADNNYLVTVRLK